MTTDMISYLRDQFTLSEPWMRYDNSDMKLLVEFLTNLKVPLPSKGQFYETRDFGGLIFLNELGLTIRITHQSAINDRIHPMVLQPILKRESKRIHIGLYPGLKLFENEEEYDRQRGDAIFKHNKLDATDTHYENIGLLPSPYDDVLIILDPDCVKGVLIHSDDVARFYNGCPQEKLFGGFKAALSEAWPDGKTCDARKMEQAMIACYIAKQEGLLFSDWLDVGYEPSWNQRQNTSQIAKRAPRAGIQLVA